MKPANSQTYPSGLYIIATPIGNLRDITLRALDVMALCDVILCEDTRVSKTLMSHYGIHAPLLSYHDHNGEMRRPKILAMLAEGKRIGLISDAGTPLISDPGFKLVREVQEAGFYVSVLPGASSVLAALCLSGIASERFTFMGFLPQKKSALMQLLETYEYSDTSLIFFESANRLLATLEAMTSRWGNREIAIARELTKRFEEIKRGSASTLLDYFRNSPNLRGEIVLIAAPNQKTCEAQDITSLLAQLLKTHRLKEAVAVAVEQTGLPRKQVYSQALALMESSSNDNA